MGKAYPEVTPSFFAEFLSGRSLVPLRLLASSTCGGLRYGANSALRGFSREALLLHCPRKTVNFRRRRMPPVKADSRICQGAHAYGSDVKPVRHAALYPLSPHRYLAIGGPEY